MNKEYLGDGVYVEVDGEDLKLSTVRGSILGNRTEHCIYLDNDMFNALKKYVERLSNEVIQKAKGETIQELDQRLLGETHERCSVCTDVYRIDDMVKGICLNCQNNI